MKIPLHIKAICSSRFWYAVFSLFLPILVFTKSVFALWGFAIPLGQPWLTGEWLIDYSSGFIRRGLFGEIVKEFAYFTDLDRILLTTLIQISIFGAYCALVSVMAIRRRASLGSMALLISPGFLMFSFFDPAGGYRKEILLFLVLSSLIVASKYLKTKALNAYLLGSSLVYVMLTFTHEIFIFTSGFIGVTLWLIFRDEKITLKVLRLNLIILVLSVLVGVFVAILSKGSATSSETVCNSVAQGLPSREICGGAIDYLRYSMVDGLKIMFTKLLTPGYLSTYIQGAMLSSLPFFLFRFSKKLTLFLLFSSVAYMSIFLIAADSGRNVYVLVSIFTMIVLGFSGTRDLREIEINFKSSLAKAVVIGLIFLFGSTWNMPHCCNTSLGFGAIPDLIAFLLRNAADLYHFFL